LDSSGKNILPMLFSNDSHPSHGERFNNYSGLS